MASRTLAGLGLKGFWDLGEDGWKDENDLNLLTVSVLVQSRALSKEATTPGAPTSGDVYIFDETHPTQANKIAVYDVATWKYLTPQTGWMIYNIAEDYYEQFDGTAWAELVFGGGGGGALPVGGSTGQVLTKQSGTDGDADWETPGVSSGTTPTIRASSTATGSGTSTAITLPTGSAAGDDCFILYTGGFGSRPPSGWAVVALVGGTMNPAVYYKRLVAGDISAGSVTVTMAGSFQHSLIAVTLNGAAGGHVWREVTEIANGQAASMIQGGIHIAPPLPPNSLMLVFTGVRGTSTLSCTEGTSINSTSNSNGSMHAFYIANPDQVMQKVTLGATSIGSQGSAFGRLVIGHA